MELLYPSNVPPGATMNSREFACTSEELSVHDDIFICRDCRLARSVAPVECNELHELYRDVEDSRYLVSVDERRGSFGQLLEEIERYHGPGRLLEVGSFLGLFLEEAQRKGWKAKGIEPSVWASQQARSRGLDVYNGPLEGFDSQAAAYDAVTLWDVLEHLFDPVDALLRIKPLLKPGGILCLTTINIGGFGAHCLRGQWPWLMRMHLHYFTRHSLTKMMEMLDFEVVRLSTYPKVLKIGYLLRRARGRLGPLAAASLWAARRIHLADRSVKVNLGDILLLIARKK